jgi:hypothetical protein
LKGFSVISFTIPIYCTLAEGKNKKERSQQQKRTQPEKVSDLGVTSSDALSLAAAVFPSAAALLPSVTTAAVVTSQAYPPW